MQTIHIATHSAERGTKLIALAHVNDSDLIYGGGVHDKVAEDLIGKMLPSIDQNRVEAVVFTYVNDKGVPTGTEDYLFYMEAGCCARQVLWVNGTRMFRMQTATLETPPVIDLTNRSITNI